MDDTRSEKSREGNLVRWLIVGGMALGFLIWGAVIFLTIGDRGSPGWNFGTVEDIPGESPYSTGASNEFLRGLQRAGKENVVEPQHVMGPGKEPATEKEKKSP